MVDLDYKGEAMLLSWSDTPAGRKITFLLPDEGTEHPFKGFKAGNKYGQRFAVGCQAIDNDDNPQPKAGELVKSVAGYAKAAPTESQRCAMLCADPGFQEWLATNQKYLWSGYHSMGRRGKSLAAVVVKEYCGMESRSALDSDPEGEHTRIWQRLRSQYETDTGRVAERRR